MHNHNLRNKSFEVSKGGNLVVVACIRCNGRTKEWKEWCRDGDGDSSLHQCSSRWRHRAGSEARIERNFVPRWPISTVQELAQVEKMWCWATICVSHLTMGTQIFTQLLEIWCVSGITISSVSIPLVSWVFPDSVILNLGQLQIQEIFRLCCIVYIVWLWFFLWILLWVLDILI